MAKTVAQLLAARNRGDWLRFAVTTIQLNQVAGLLNAGFHRLDSDLVEVADEMVRQTVVLESIEHALQNPLFTVSAELTRRGVRAVREGWWADAVAELDRALENDRFNAVAHLARGMALSNLDGPAAAVGSWEAAARFGGGTDVGATGAVLAMAAYSSGGDAVSQRRVAEAASNAYPTCAEVLLGAGLALESRSHVACAIDLDPAIACVAVALGAPGADESARRSAADSRGVVACVYRLRYINETLGYLGSNLQLPSANDHESDTAAQRLMAAGQILSSITPWLPRALHELRHASNRRADQYLEILAKIARGEQANQTLDSGYYRRVSKRQAHPMWLNASYYDKRLAQFDPVVLDAQLVDLGYIEYVTTRLRPNGLG